MKNFRKICRRLSAIFLAAAIILAGFCISSKDASASELEAGTYEMSGELSAYLAAMGGVEFGGPLLSGVYFVVDESGNEYLKLTFTKSSVTIYSITCDTFVDPSPSTVTTTRGVEDGTIGIYDASGNLITEGVTYTLSSDTALNSASEEVNYVDSATFPISSREDSYNLAIYINSNVMGVEFCNENSAATETTYAATLTVNWSNVDALEADAETTTEETTEETTQETTTIEADEDLEGLAIYEAGDDEEDDEADGASADDAAAAADEDTVSESSGSTSSTILIVVIIIIVVVIIAVILIIVVCTKNKKKKSSAPVKPLTGTENVSDETVIIKKEDMESKDK